MYFFSNTRLTIKIIIKLSNVPSVTSLHYDYLIKTCAYTQKCILIWSIAQTFEILNIIVIITRSGCTKLIEKQFHNKCVL